MATLPLLEDGHLIPSKHELDWTIRDELSGWINTERLQRDTTILSQGTAPDNFYLLRNGLLGIYRDLPDGKSVLIGKLRPGECIGVTHLSLNNEFPARIQPIKESITLLGQPEDIDRLKTDYPETLTQAALKESYVFTGMYDRIKTILSQDTKQRIARELLEFASDAGRKNGRGIKLLVKLTRKDISQIVGCAHESASRIMSNMEKEGIIETKHKYITIKKPERLLCLAE